MTTRTAFIAGAILILLTSCNQRSDAVKLKATLTVGIRAISNDVSEGRAFSREEFDALRREDKKIPSGFRWCMNDDLPGQLRDPNEGGWILLTELQNERPFATAEASKASEDEPSIKLTIKKWHRKAFADMTEKFQHRELVFILDGKIASTAMIQARIEDDSVEWALGGVTTRERDDVLSKLTQ